MEKIAKCFLYVTLFLFVLGISVNAHADNLSFNLGDLLPGQSISPASSIKPWLTATFIQVNGGVDLTLSAPQLTGKEFVSDWDFNINPLLNSKDISVTYVSGNGPASASIAIGQNIDKADGTGGYFDIDFGLPTKPVSARFTGGDR